MRVRSLLIGAIVFGFPIAPAQAQRPDVWNAPPTDRQHSPAEAGTTLDRAGKRNAPHEISATPKSVEEDLSCLLPPLTSVRSPTIAAAGLKIPTNAKKAYANACAALKDKKTESVEKYLHKAVQEYPQYSAA